MEKIIPSEGADTLITSHLRQGQLPWQVEKAISIAPEGVKECDGTHSECCARRVPHSEDIARHIEWRDPRGHAAIWL